MDTAINWVQVADHVAWEPRDSMGKLVFRDRIWILGGWFGSGTACPCDVWSSADGSHWTLAQKATPWRHSDLPSCVVFKDRMWVMGGWYNGRLPGCESGNEVWSSADGVNWARSREHAQWSPRVGAAAVAFKGRMWILGGQEHYFAGNEETLRNDVWSSSDGEHWEKATDHAGWAPRAFHQAVVFDDKIWIFSGGNYLPEYKEFSDVWYSEDGIVWHEATAKVPWNPRLWFSAVVYRDHMWILGGWSNNPFLDWNDVWYSKDGKNWKQLKSDVVWSKRHEHATYVFHDKIWVTGGHARPLNNEVWYLELPKDWDGNVTK